MSPVNQKVLKNANFFVFFFFIKKAFSFYHTILTDPKCFQVDNLSYISILHHLPHRESQY